MEISLLEKLAVLTALQKAVKDQITEVRAEADSEMYQLYSDDRITKRALKLGDTKVGDYLVSETKESYTIEDNEAFEDFALTYGFADEVKIIDPSKMLEAIAFLQENNPTMIASEIVIDGNWEKAVTNTCGIATYLDTGLAIPGVKINPPTYKNTQVRGCKPEDVLPALQRSLDGMSVTQFLLGGE